MGACADALAVTSALVEAHRDVAAATAPLWVAEAFTATSIALAVRAAALADYAGSSRGGGVGADGSSVLAGHTTLDLLRLLHAGSSGATACCSTPPCTTNGKAEPSIACAAAPSKVALTRAVVARSVATASVQTESSARRKRNREKEGERMGESTAVQG